MTGLRGAFHGSDGESLHVQNMSVKTVFVAYGDPQIYPGLAGLESGELRTGHLPSSILYLSLDTVPQLSVM